MKGGCQCGAVRYEITGPLHDPHLCHCRMCQKAFGNYFAALAGVLKKDLKWTRGEPGYFRSSSTVPRGFCRDCGTPLTFSRDHSKYTSVAIGSFDDPATVMLENQYGIESRLPAFATMHQLHGRRTEDDISPEQLALLKSLQHPDHD